MGKEANMDDAEALREYVTCRSEKAFAELVGRHVDLVYSSALRMVRNPALAEDVTQAVFIQLARHAPVIRSGNALPGWLYRVTHGQAANAVRAECTRRRYETEATNMIQTPEEPSAAWESIAPHLEEAMSALSDEDQNAVLQRFFQGRSWREVGSAMSLSEDGAQKRVSRALDKLRLHLSRRGIAVTTSVIGMALVVNAVQAAPAGLGFAVTTASLAGTAGTGTLTSTALKLWLTKKTTVGLLAGLALIAAVTIPLAVSAARKARAEAPVTESSLSRGQVLHMTFDQDEAGSGVITDSSGKAKGGKITDSSGSGNDGMAAGVRWTADGKRGGAYEFTADGDQIEISNNPSLNPKQLTLAAWIKTTNKDAAWRRIFDKSYSQGYALSIAGEWQGNNWNGRASLEIGPGTHLSSTKSMVADGQWHHLVATFDGTEQWLYVDGKPEGQALVWEKPGQVGATGFNLVIGCNRSNLAEDDLGKSFRGFIDEPRMWNRALSPKEVAFLYQSQQ